MLKFKVNISNKNGLHTRPAAKLVKLTSKFKSHVELERDGFRINAKSIIGVMTLAAEFGSSIDVFVNGDDENEASEAIKELFENGFGEL